MRDTDSASRVTRTFSPLDRHDLAAGRLDPRDRLARVFDRGRHVMRVGVNDGVGVAHDRDMAFPEDQVAALQLVRSPPRSAPGRGRPAACRCRAGSRCRRRSARPAPGRSNRCRGCSCRPTDRACRRSVRRPRQNPSRIASRPPRWRRGRYQPSRVTANAPSSRVTVTHAPHRQRLDRRQLDRGSGKRKGPQRRDLVRRRGRGLRQRGIGQPADIAVAVELAPGPAFAVAVVDRDALAFQRLRRQHRHRATAPRAAARARRATSNSSPATKRAALTLPSRYFAARSGRAGVRRGSSIAFAQQFVDRARGLAFAAFGPRRLCRRRPAVDVDMQPAFGVPSTKRCRNSAQVIEPAKPPDGALLMSATFESSQRS